MTSQEILEIVLRSRHDPQGFRDYEKNVSGAKQGTTGLGQAQTHAATSSKELAAAQQAVASGAKVAAVAVAAGTAALAVFAAAATEAVETLSELTTRGSAVEKVRSGFEALSRSAGLSSSELLRASQTATRGLVADYDLMLASNKALLLGLPVTAKEMNILASTSLALGRAMGQTATKSLDDLITGLGRGSARILDNIGIMIEASDVHKQWAQAHNTTVEKMSEAEKNTAIYTAAVKAATEAQARLGAVTLTAGEEIDRSSRALSNLYDELARVVATNDEYKTLLRDVAEATGDAVTWTVKHKDEINGLWTVGVKAAKLFYEWTFEPFVRGAKTAAAAADSLKDTLKFFGGYAAGDEAIGGGGTNLGAKKLFELFHGSPQQQKEMLAGSAAGLAHMREEEKKELDKLEKERKAAAKKLAEANRRLRDEITPVGDAAWLKYMLDGRGGHYENNLPPWMMSQYGAGQDIGSTLSGAPSIGGNGKSTVSGQFDEWLAKQQDITKATFDWSRALGDVSHAFQAMGISADNAFGKIVVGFMAGMAGAQQMRELAKQQGGTVRVGQFGMGARGAGMGAYSSGSMLGGAVQGASFGSAFGPWGTAIGAGAGAVLGLFGKGAREKKEAEALRKELLDTYGGMEALRKKAGELGVSIDKAFSSNKPKDVKAVMDSMADAADKAAKRFAALQSAAAGLAQYTRGLAQQFANRAPTEGDGSEARFNRAGMYASAIFGAMIKETGDVIAALRALEDVLANLAAMQEKFGFKTSAVLQELLNMRKALGENQELADQISGLNQMMNALYESGYMTKELFAAFGQDATALFNELVAGMDASIPATERARMALAMMQPTLQRLWEMHNDLGYPIDENTRLLLEQAEAEGLVGDKFRSTEQKILAVLEAIARALGALPDQKDIRINVHTNHTSSGTPPPSDPNPEEPYQNALGVNRYFPARPGGYLMRVAEGGYGEHVAVTPEGQMGRGGAGGQGGGVQVGTLNITLPNVTNAREFAEQLKDALYQNVNGAGRAAAAAAAKY